MKQIPRAPMQRVLKPPMRRLGYSPTLNQLRRRAAKYGLAIRRDVSGYFLFADARSRFTFDAEPKTLRELANWLDDGDDANE